MHALDMGMNHIVETLADLEANAFDSYIQNQFVDLGFEPLSLNQMKRFKESIPKWESALAVCNMRQVG
jgi:hypothetical protein